MNRLRASCRAAGCVRRFNSRLKSCWFSSIKWESVSRLCGIRAMICSLVSRSVSETLIVRSKGSAPLWTFTSAPTVARIAMAQPITRAAEALPRDLDLLGQGDLFRAGQQRNLRHLAQIHADRIAAELRHFAGQRGRIDRPAGHFALGQIARRRPRPSSEASAAS